MPTTFPIIMKVWAGAESHDFKYITRSLPSLLKSDLPEGAEILLFDDCSTDLRLQPFLREIAEQDSRVHIFKNEINKGPNLGQSDTYAMVESKYHDAPFLINIDDDVIYHRKWLVKLLEAWKELRAFGVNGIYTALNMPFRMPYATICTYSHTYLLKWKQPALNWLIPRAIYEQIGPFIDEGIAYDTVYSHWMRLNGYPIICLKPSFVQNIGTFGAYSRDDTTTAHDFVGENEGGSWFTTYGQCAWGKVRRPWQRLCRWSGHRFSLVAPIRWGSEWVYEGRTRAARSVAICLIDEAVRLGWNRDAVAKRAREIYHAQSQSPVALSTIHHSLRGVPVAIQYDWTFLPNLRESRKYQSYYPLPAPQTLLTAVLRDLLPLHKAGAVHNKIRQENIYVSSGGKDVYLAWYGTEPPPRTKLLPDKEWAITTFGDAVDKRASRKVRERFATFYLEAVAPEVLAGAAATFRSDIFAVGAVVLLSLHPEIETLAQFESLRKAWASGAIGIPQAVDSPDLNSLITRCLATDPAHRFENAVELYQALA